jgi:predicted Zn finger-like uncharacterized protein
MSRMFTTCPACRMNLAVTAQDLRIGQGYVRCGRCERVFNALLSLQEDLDPAEQSGHAATGTASLPQIDEEQDRIPARTRGRQLASGDEDVDVFDSQSTGTFETIVLEGDTFLQTEEHVAQEDMEERFQELTGQHSVPREPAAMLDADAAVGNTPRPHWGWILAVAALLLLLVGQLVHHNRQALVASPLLEKPLQGIYRMFGAQLEPAWDLAAYDLRQLGGEALALNSTTIVLRATVQNKAPNRQPPPLIRAVLQDRYGNALSTTSLTPAEYLRGDTPARMAPDQRLDAELHLEDPHRQAVGFELDACLPGADGRLHCANDR